MRVWQVRPHPRCCLAPRPPGPSAAAVWLWPLRFAPPCPSPAPGGKQAGWQAAGRVWVVGRLGSSGASGSCCTGKVGGWEGLQPLCALLSRWHGPASHLHHTPAAQHIFHQLIGRALCQLLCGRGNTSSGASVSAHGVEVPQCAERHLVCACKRASAESPYGGLAETEGLILDSWHATHGPPCWKAPPGTAAGPAPAAAARPSGGRACSCRGQPAGDSPRNKWLHRASDSWAGCRAVP